MGLSLSLVVFLILSICYIVFLRVTDVGETLRLESEISEKSKQYGMYVTRGDFERAIQGMPDNRDFIPDIGVLLIEANDQVDVDGTFLEGLFGFEETGKFPKTDGGLKKLRQDIAKYQAKANHFFAMTDFKRQRSWEMTDFFVDQHNTFEYLSRMQEFLLYDAALEAKAGHTSIAVDRIRSEAQIRRFFASSAHFYRGGINAVNSSILSQLFYLRILQGVKPLDPTVLQAIKEGQATPVPFDYKHLCRAVFYMGADWFPQGRSVSEVARPEDKFWSKIPRLTKAWKIRIEETAIEAYEAGLKSDNDIDALKESIKVLEKSHNGGEWSRMSEFWSMPGIKSSGKEFSLEFESASSKLKKLMSEQYP